MPVDEEGIVLLCQPIVKKEAADFHRLPPDDSLSIAQLACLSAVRKHKEVYGPFIPYLRACIRHFLEEEVKKESRNKRCERFNLSLDRRVRGGQGASTLGAFFPSSFDLDEIVAIRIFMAALTHKERSVVTRLLMDFPLREVQNELGLNDFEIGSLMCGIAEKHCEYLSA